MPSGAGGLQWPPVRGRLMGSLRCNDTAFLADCSQDLDVAKLRIIGLCLKNICVAQHFVKALLTTYSVR